MCQETPSSPNHYLYLAPALLPRWSHEGSHSGLGGHCRVKGRGDYNHTFNLCEYLRYGATKKTFVRLMILIHAVARMCLSAGFFAPAIAK